MKLGILLLMAAARYRAPRQAPVVPLLLLSSEHDQLVDSRCSQAIASSSSHQRRASAGTRQPRAPHARANAAGLTAPLRLNAVQGISRSTVLLRFSCITCVEARPAPLKPARLMERT